MSSYWRALVGNSKGKSRVKGTHQPASLFKENLLRRLVRKPTHPSVTDKRFQAGS